MASRKRKTKAAKFPQYVHEEELEEEKVYTTEDAKKKIGEFLGKYGRIIALGVAAIVIVFFGINFLLNMNATLRVSVYDVEDNPLEDNMVKIFNESGRIIAEDSGLKSYTFELPKGRYEIRVYAVGYKTEVKKIMLDSDKSVSFSLVKNMKLYLDGMEIPQRLYLGQTFDMNVIIRNEETISVSAILVFDDLLSKFNCDKTTIVAEPASTKKYSLKCSVPEDLQLNNNCESKNTSVRLMYLKQKQNAKFEICKVPEITLSDVSFSVEPVSKPKDRRDLIIRNNSRFPAEHIKLSIEITSASKNAPQDVLRWISFSNAEGANKRVRNIDVMEARSRIEEPIEVEIPVTAKAEVIYGNIILEAPFLEKPLKSKLTITVRGEAEVSLSANISPLRVKVYERDGKIEEKVIDVTVRNTGDLTVNNISIKIKNEGECSSEWLTNLTTPLIEELKRGESKKVSFIATTPESAEKGDVMRCILEITYKYPLPPYDTKVEEIGFVEIVRG